MSPIDFFREFYTTLEYLSRNVLSILEMFKKAYLGGHVKKTT